jgi:hypothetical protein
MTGPWHYAEAERLAKKAADYEGLPSNHHVQLGQLAQVHATLAHAAATALQREGADRAMPSKDHDAWFGVAAECRKAATS